MSEKFKSKKAEKFDADYQKLFYEQQVDLTKQDAPDMPDLSELVDDEAEDD